MPSLGGAKRMMMWRTVGQGPPPDGFHGGRPDGLRNLCGTIYAIAGAKPALLQVPSAGAGQRRPVGRGSF